MISTKVYHQSCWWTVLVSIAAQKTFVIKMNFRRVNSNLSVAILDFPRIVALYPLSKRTKGKDISGNQNRDGELHQVYPARGPDGLPDGSYYFPGRKTSYIKFPNNGKLDSYYSITLLAWVYPEGSGPIFHFAPGGVRFWVVRPNTLFVRFVRRTGRPTRQLISRKLIPKQWNYVGASYDERTGIATLWRNSSPIKSVYIGRIRLATNRPVRMGALSRDLRYFRGRISCMQVYSVPLSGPEIRRAKKVCFRARKLIYGPYPCSYCCCNWW